MKRISLRRIIIIAVLIAILFMLSRLVNIGEGFWYPSFTTFSTRQDGVALVYDTLRIMGYPVGRDLMFLSAERPTDNVQFVIAPRIFSDAHRDGMIDWVIRGGQLMFFSDHWRDEERLFADFTPDRSMHVFGGTIHRIGFGTLFIGDAQSITNISLFETGGEYGQAIVDILDTMEFRRIYFNEAYHGYGTSITFFEMLPLPLRLMGIQLAVVAAVFTVYAGKRFGKPTPYYEEVEREENEYVFTLSNLYMSMGFGQAALAVYEKKFKKQAAKYFRTISEPEFSEIYNHWKNENKGSLGKLEYIIENKDREFNTKRQKERGEFMKMAAYYRELAKMLTRFR